MTTGTNQTPLPVIERLIRVTRKGPVHVLLGLVGLLWLLPSIGLLVTSFRTRSASSQSGWWTAAWEGGWTLDNYDTILSSSGEGLPPPGFAKALWNTVIITVPSTILPVIVASLAAYGLVWMNFRFRNTIYLGIVAMLVIPLQVTWVPVLKLFNTLDLTGSFNGLILAHTAYGLPFAVFLLVRGFSEVPRSLIEAARIDGASHIQTFRKIVLPLAMPVIISLTIFQFVWVWNDLMNALIFVQDVNKFPLTISIRNLLGQYGNEWHLLAAGAFVSMVVPLIVFLSLQRFYVRGLTAGAVKG